MDKKKKKYFLLFFYWLGINPMFVAMFMVYLNAQSDLEMFALGLYALLWFVLGFYLLLWPILKSLSGKAQEKQKIRTTDEIIDDCWKEHEKEKENASN